MRIEGSSNYFEYSNLDRNELNNNSKCFDKKSSDIYDLDVQIVDNVTEQPIGHNSLWTCPPPPTCLDASCGPCTLGECGPEFQK